MVPLPPRGTRYHIPAVLPSFITPASPVLRSEPPAGPQWSHEVKFDGWRVQLRRDGQEAVLLSRTGLAITPRFSHVARAAEKLPGRNFILDGEMVVLGPDGKPDFGAVGSRRSTACLCAFDILFADGQDLRSQPLAERRRRLWGLLEEASASCLYQPPAFNDATALLTVVEAMGLEGIVSKRIDAPYRSGTRCGWIKVKTAAWKPIGQERQRRFTPPRWRDVKKRNAPGLSGLPEVGSSLRPRTASALGPRLPLEPQVLGRRVGHTSDTKRNYPTRQNACASHGLAIWRMSA